MNWKSTVLAAIVTGLVTVLTGLLLYHYELREPKLRFTIDHSIPFQGNKQSLTIQNATFRNDGSGVVKNVIMVMTITDGSVIEHRLLADPSLSLQEHSTPGLYRVDIPSMNPSDKVQVSLLTGSMDLAAPTVSISFRGDGVTGEPMQASDDVRSKWPLITALISAYAGIAAAALFSRRVRLRLLQFAGLTIGSKAALPQNQVIGSAFALRGDIDSAEHYLRRNDRSSYWAESDLMTARAISQGNPDAMILTLSVLADLLANQSMEDRSRAIVYVNIARLEHRLENDANAREALRLGNNFSSEAVEHRLERDQEMCSFLVSSPSFQRQAG